MRIEVAVGGQFFNTVVADIDVELGKDHFVHWLRESQIYISIYRTSERGVTWIDDGREIRCESLPTALIFHKARNIMYET